MKRVLLLGSNNITTSQAYHGFGFLPSTLVNQVGQEFVIGHTARQEFASDADFEKVLSSADEIYWTKPDPADFGTKEIYYEFLEWLKYYHRKHNNIVNFNSILIDVNGWDIQLPTLTADDAVFLGCSFTAGVGLVDKNTHWSSIVAKQFNKNCINLSKAGGSNLRSFDILSRLNFVPGQIVVWQITSLERLQYCFEDKKLRDLVLARDTNIDIHRELVTIFHKDFLLYDLLIKLRMFSQLSAAMKLKSVFWLINYKDEQVYSRENQMHFYRFKEFIPGYRIQNFIVDHGTDNRHPGINSNKLIADAVIEHLTETYY